MQTQTDLAAIKEKLRREFPLLAERYRVQSVGVFGSYVRHEQRPESDVDVTCHF